MARLGNELLSRAFFGGGGLKKQYMKNSFELSLSHRNISQENRKYENKIKLENRGISPRSE
jgi:hypothetical protein